MTMTMSCSAYDVLVSKSRSAKKRRCNDSGGGGGIFFPCPAGCGLHVSERDVNYHLDSCRCLKMNKGRGKESESTEEESYQHHTIRHPDTHGTVSDVDELPGSAAQGKAKCSNNVKNTSVFQQMMKRSAEVYSNNGNIQQRFHLHNAQGLVSWVSGDDRKEAAEDLLGKTHDNITFRDGDIAWSTTVILKNVKIINMQGDGEQQQRDHPMQESPIQLTISSSIPSSFSKQPPQPPSSINSITTKPKQLPRLVQRHSRLSISQLKSCLQKSIRRRAPLPAVRVAMELADRSWTDLIRRLPIIILEDSTLHPDFSLLVWLMITDSKGYVPPKELIVKVMQIVFEVAACPWQDSITILSESEHSNNECSRTSPTKDSIVIGSNKVDNKRTLFSLSSSVSDLFPTQQHQEQASIYEAVIIRSILLRAQYGGMKCDVDMCHSFSKIWLQRFNGVISVPTTVASNCAPDSIKTSVLSWKDIPLTIHSSARQQSEKLVTISIFSYAGVVNSLTTIDVCPAGIDFHCSSVVDHLLSQPNVYDSLCDRLESLLSTKSEISRDWIASKVKQCIWNYSSGVNRRRPLIGSSRKTNCESDLKGIWDDVISSPFDIYVKNFVKDRLN